MTEAQPEQQLEPRTQSRRLARELAVKSAYALEIRGGSLEEILQDPLITFEGSLPAYTVRLMTHVERFKEHLDDLIREKVEKWEFHRLAILDRIILCIAIAELLYFPDVPPKVSINEAIEIAKKYSTLNSGRFVNGILDAVWGNMRSRNKTANGDNRSDI